MKTFVAFCPILWLLLSLSLLRFKASQATLISLLLTILIALCAFPAFPIPSICSSVVSGISLAVCPICLVILAALFTHAVVVESGAMEVIRTGLTEISQDERIRALLIVWGFGNFMEGIAGFGTSVAIPTSILIGIGFSPMKAILMCLVSNTTPSAFGSIGVPLLTLARVTGINAHTLASHTALMQCLITAAAPFLILLVLGGRRALRGLFGLLLLVDLAFLVPWILVSFYGGFELPNIIGALCVMTLLILKSSRPHALNYRLQIWAWLPFGLVVVFLISATLLPPHIKSYSPAAALMFLGALLGGRIQGLPLSTLSKVLLRTLWRCRSTFVTIASMLAMAHVMDNAGMIAELAQALVGLTGNTYPFFAPIIGALGSFVTGSVTSSNVLFGAMQANIAMDLSISPFTLAASNAMGASIGKMISPQSIAIGVAAAGLVGQESAILKQALAWFPWVLFVACLVSAISAFFL